MMRVMMVTVRQTHLHVSCNFHTWRRRIVVVAMMIMRMRAVRPMVGLMLTINLNRIILRPISFIILVIILIILVVLVVIVDIVVVVLSTVVIIILLILINLLIVLTF